MIIIYIALVLAVSALVWHFSTVKFLNPYKLFYLMGKKGSGKTTLIAKLCLQYIKKGYPVYCTIDIPGTYKIEPTDIGKYYIPPGSVLMIDEVSLIWDNRKWKNMDDEVIKWFRYMRQYKLICYMFSQSYDVDLKIRNLVDEMYLIRRYFRVLSCARRIDKNLMIHRSTAEAPSTIAEDFELVPLLSPDSVKVTYMPKYFPYFNSFDPPALPSKEYEYREPLEIARFPKFARLKSAYSVWAYGDEEENSADEEETE